MDHSNPSVVYLSRLVKGIREIERWVTGDGGKTWRTQAVTSGSKRDNIPPSSLEVTASAAPLSYGNSSTVTIVNFEISAPPLKP